MTLTILVLYRTLRKCGDATLASTTVPMDQLSQGHLKKWVTQHVRVRRDREHYFHFWC